MGKHYYGCSATRNKGTCDIRPLFSEIRLTPEGGVLAIELVGELAGLLSLGLSQNEQSHPKVACSTTLVAGARYQRYLRSLVHAHG